MSEAKAFLGFVAGAMAMIMLFGFAAVVMGTAIGLGSSAYEWARSLAP